MALTLRTRGARAEGVELLRDASAAEPLHRGILFERSIDQRERGQLDEAEAACRQALDPKPEAADVLAEFALCCRRLGDRPGALALLRRAALADPLRRGLRRRRHVELFDHQDVQGVRIKVDKRPRGPGPGAGTRGASTATTAGATGTLNFVVKDFTTFVPVRFIRMMRSSGYAARMIGAARIMAWPVH